MAAPTARSANRGSFLLAANPVTHVQSASRVGCISLLRLEQCQQSTASARRVTALIRTTRTSAGVCPADLGPSIPGQSAAPFAAVPLRLPRRGLNASGRRLMPCTFRGRGRASGVVLRTLWETSPPCRWVQHRPVNACAGLVLAGAGVLLALR